MSNFSIMEIMGPVMIGPSSSHTAGAEKLGKAAGSMVGSEFDEALFYLHGSFSATYIGHGTNKALVAGILGMEPDDERLRDSLLIAEEKGIKVEFIEADLGEVHPNTVKIVLKYKGKTLLTIMGSSIGGGNIMINEIDGCSLEISGKYPVVIVKHRDVRGMVSRITGILAQSGVNIATLKVSRESKGEIATTIIETDNESPENTAAEILKIENVISVKKIAAIK
ncbi:MAG: L-serine dehydratase, iron-sulfur-dependent, beta subunit [Clostridia bacterium]|jgi:L-serine dehydratase|nr:L-serine dehydratase, iron-sulfur-dependent, beta subunit [Clostridia bacterium]